MGRGGGVERDVAGLPLLRKAAKAEANEGGSAADVYCCRLLSPGLGARAAGGVGADESLSMSLGSLLSFIRDQLDTLAESMSSALRPISFSTTIEFASRFALRVLQWAWVRGRGGWLCYGAQGLVVL